MNKLRLNVCLKMQQLLYVSGDSYEFSDDTFANDEDKSEEDLDFVATFS